MKVGPAVSRVALVRAWTRAPASEPAIARDVLPGQPDLQRLAAPRYWQPQHPALHAERARIPADRHQRPLAPGEPRRRITSPAELPRAEPRVAVPAQHRPGTVHVQFPERPRAGRGQLLAQVLVADDLRVVPLPTPPVQVQHAAPHVTGRAQQPEQAARLPVCDAQPAPRRPVHHRRRSGSTLPAHGSINSTTHRQNQITPRKAGARQNALYQPRLRGTYIFDAHPRKAPHPLSSASTPDELTVPPT